MKPAAIRSFCIALIIPFVSVFALQPEGGYDGSGGTDGEILVSTKSNVYDTVLDVSYVAPTILKLLLNDLKIELSEGLPRFAEQDFNLPISSQQDKDTVVKLLDESLLQNSQSLLDVLNSVFFESQKFVILHRQDDQSCKMVNPMNLNIGGSSSCECWDKQGEAKVATYFFRNDPTSKIHNGVMCFSAHRIQNQLQTSPTTISSISYIAGIIAHELLHYQTGQDDFETEKRYSVFEGYIQKMLPQSRKSLFEKTHAVHNQWHDILNHFHSINSVFKKNPIDPSEELVCNAVIDAFNELPQSSGHTSPVGSLSLERIFRPKNVHVYNRMWQLLEIASVSCGLSYQFLERIPDETRIASSVSIFQNMSVDADEEDATGFSWNDNDQYVARSYKELVAGWEHNSRTLLDELTIVAETIDSKHRTDASNIWHELLNRSQLYCQWTDGCIQIP